MNRTDPNADAFESARVLSFCWAVFAAVFFVGCLIWD